MRQSSREFSKQWNVTVRSHVGDTATSANNIQHSGKYRHFKSTRQWSKLSVVRITMFHKLLKIIGVLLNMTLAP